MIRLLEQLELDLKTIKKFRRDHMESNLKELFTDVEGVEQLVDIFKVVDFNDIACWVDDIETLLTIGNLQTAHLCVHVANEIVTNLPSLIWNAEYNKGQLCSDAERLQSVIEQMQQELDDFINTMLLIEQQLQNGFMKKTD